MVAAELVGQGVHPFEQRGSVAGHVDEHELRPHVHGNLLQAVGVAVHRLVEASLVGYGDEPAVQFEGPSVVGAHEAPTAVAGALHQRAGPMGAHVGEGPQLAVAAPDHDHRLVADGLGDVVARLAELGQVAHEHPRLPEGHPHLEVVQRLGEVAGRVRGRLDDDTVEHDGRTVADGGVPVVGGGQRDHRLAPVPVTR